MENKVKLYGKLHAIQKSVMGLGKDSKSFGYSYVSGSKVLEQIKPLMNSLGLILKQEVLSIDNERQDYKAKSGDKSEILTRVHMKFTWVDVETGEVDENLFAANGQNDWEKGLGSALTYGERYFLLKYFHISTDEDDIDNPERKPEVVVKGKDLHAVTKESNPEGLVKPSGKEQLTEGHAKAQGAINAVNKGTYTIDQVKAKYDISPEVLAKMNPPKK